jgi:RimJ/RimL family protein N-acetyltransferase
MNTDEPAPGLYHITTERLGFRKWVLADLALARDLWTDVGVMRFMGGAMTEQQVHARFMLEMNCQNQFGHCYWPIEFLHDRSFAGVCGLRQFHESHRVLELGVHVHSHYWGLHLGEEAARAAIDYGFSTLGAEKLMAGHGPGHQNSQGLINRLGFHFSHEEAWGAEAILHPFYELRRDSLAG